MNIIEQIIDKTGFSYSKIARETNINRFKISDYRNNKQDLSINDREILTKYLSSLQPQEKENIIEENIIINNDIQTKKKKLSNDRGWLCCENKHFGCLVTRKNQKIALDNEMKCPICNSKLILKTRRKNEQNI